MTTPTNCPRPPSIKALAEKWPSAIVARKSVAEFSGGLLHPRTMANLDSEKAGPPRLLLGRKVAYPVEGLCDWLSKRIQVEA